MIKEEYFEGAIITSEEMLQLYIQKWQKRLGLERWKIASKLGDGADNRGECAYTRVTREALITVESAEAWTEQMEEGKFNKAFKFDMEQVIVHELLHLNFVLVTDFMNGEDLDKSLEYDLTHALIEDLAKAFVETERAEKEDGIKKENTSEDSNKGKRGRNNS